MPTREPRANGLPITFVRGATTLNAAPQATTVNLTGGTLNIGTRDARSSPVLSVPRA